MSPPDDRPAGHPGPQYAKTWPISRMVVHDPSGQVIRVTENTHYCLGCGEQQRAEQSVHGPDCELRDRLDGATTDAKAAERIRALMTDGPAMRGLREQLNEQEADLREAYRERDAEREDKGKLQNRLDKAEAELGRKELERSQLAEQLSRAHADIDAMIVPDSELARMRDQRDSARGELHDTRRARDEARAERDALKADVQQLKADVTNARRIVDQVRHRTRTLEQLNEQQRVTIDRLKRRQRQQRLGPDASGGP